MIDFEKNLDLLQEKSGKSREELLKLVNQQKEKYGAMLTDDGIVMLLASEMKIDLNIKKREIETLKISQLVSGLKNVELIVQVKKIFNEKKFEKNGRKGKVLSMIVFDDTGEVRMSLWNKELDLIEKEKIEKGNKLKIKNCVVNEYNEKLQISLGYKGTIEVIERSNVKRKKISELADGLQDVDVAGFILRKFNPRYFEYQGEERKVINFELQDETGKIRCVAWNDLAETINNISIGTKIKVEGAYTKKGMNGLELHLGWNSRIIKDYWEEIEKPKELIKEFKRYSLKELKGMEAENNAEIKGIIVSVKRNEMHYKACKKCGKKLKKNEEKFICEKCGETENIQLKPFINLIVDDGTYSINAIAFNETARKLEVKEEELKEFLEKDKLNDYLNLIESRLLGKNVILQGRTKRNNYSNEMELIISEIKEMNVEQEAEKMLNG